jgi:hypothetical protein
MVSKDSTAKTTKQFAKEPLPAFRPINGQATILRGGKFPKSGKVYVIFEDKRGKGTFSPKLESQAERILSKYTGMKAPVEVIAKWNDGEIQITEA